MVDVKKTKKLFLFEVLLLKYSFFFLFFWCCSFIFFVHF